MPIKWTPNAYQILLAIILDTSGIVVDVEKVAKNWPVEEGEERPTPRAIRERIAKIKKNVSNPRKAPTKGKKTSGSAEAAPAETAPIEATSFEAAPFDAAPFDAAPFDAAPFDAASFDVAPFDTASFEAAPFEAAPFEAAPFDATSFDIAPFEATPFEAASFDTVPAEITLTNNLVGQDTIINGHKRKFVMSKDYHGRTGKKTRVNTYLNVDDDEDYDDETFGPIDPNQANQAQYVNDGMLCMLNMHQYDDEGEARAAEPFSN